MALKDDLPAGIRIFNPIRAIARVVQIVGEVGQDPRLPIGIGERGRDRLRLAQHTEGARQFTKVPEREVERHPDVDGLLLRMTRSRDIRAPSLSELFSIGGISATGSFVLECSKHVPALGLEAPVFGAEPLGAGVFGPLGLRT